MSRLRGVRHRLVGVPRDVDTKTRQMLPSWAPRVTQREIRRLYETDAKGIHDEELTDEVGYGLLARCQSFVDAAEALQGRARCPRCYGVVTHSCKPREILKCRCGWELSWGDYFGTIRRRQLSGAEPVLRQFRDFVQAFPAADTPQQKTLFIDQLIHGFHWYYKNNAPTRPVAVNLIEGRLSDVVAFLDNLSYGDNGTAGMARTYAQWGKLIEVNASWYASRRKRKTRAGVSAGTTR